jgi:hypothetical protein
MVGKTPGAWKSQKIKKLLLQFGSIFGAARLMFSGGEKHPDLFSKHALKDIIHLSRKGGWLREAVAPNCSCAGLICLVLQAAPPHPYMILLQLCAIAGVLLQFRCNSGAILVQFWCNSGAIAVQFALAIGGNLLRLGATQN